MNTNNAAGQAATSRTAASIAEGHPETPAPAAPANAAPQIPHREHPQGLNKPVGESHEAGKDAPAPADAAPATPRTVLPSKEMEELQTLAGELRTTSKWRVSSAQRTILLNAADAVAALWWLKQADAIASRSTSGRSEPPHYTAGRQRQADADALYRIAKYTDSEFTALGCETRQQAVEFAADMTSKNTLVTAVPSATQAPTTKEKPCR